MSLRSLLGGAYRPRAESPVPYTGRRGLMPFGFSFGGSDSMSTTDELEQYSTTGTLFGVVSKLAMLTSQVNWRLYARAASGIEEDRTEVPPGRQIAPRMVWSRPNPFMTSHRFVETFQQHIDLTGKAFWVVARVGTIPVEVWPVRPDRIYPVPSRGEFIRGYVYCGPDGEEIPLRREDVTPLIWPAPLDVYDGMGPLPSLAADIRGESAQREWQKNFFRNSAQPGGIIETGGPLGETQFEELLDRWNRSHRGISNAGRVGVLEQGKFTPLSYSQKDMQFVESRGITKQAILDAYGMPKFGIGDVTDVNRASAVASRGWIAESLTIPRLDRIKDALNTDFLEMFGMEKTHEFDYDNPVPEDQETENATLTAKCQAVGVLIGTGFNPDQACDTVGLPRMVWEEYRRGASDRGAVNQ